MAKLLACTCLLAKLKAIAESKWYTHNNKNSAKQYNEVITKPSGYVVAYFVHIYVFQKLQIYMVPNILIPIPSMYMYLGFGLVYLYKYHADFVIHEWYALGKLGAAITLESSLCISILWILPKYSVLTISQILDFPR